MADGFAGLSALIADLEKLPEELKLEASGIVRSTVDLMAAEVEAAYPEKDGDLKRGVKKSMETELRGRVRSTVKHAHLYERGTVQRSTASTGANRGTMPAKPTFIPAAVRARERMRTRLIDVVKKSKVRGMTGTLEVRET